MQTIYDWVTMALFAGLITLFLHRSSQPEPVDHLWQYLPPMVGLALANYLGNHDQGLIAIGVILLGIGYLHLVLKPWPKR